jgi:hydroxymethylbilane synthase
LTAEEGGVQPTGPSATVAGGAPGRPHTVAVGTPGRPHTVAAGTPGRPHTVAAGTPGGSQTVAARTPGGPQTVADGAPHPAPTTAGRAGPPLRIGTRGSALALAQARAVADALPAAAELVAITTAGDVDRGHGDKSRWVGALEAALVAGEIDLAVHSAKDVPGELAPGTAIVAAPRRADPMDVLVGERQLADVREGARVGTSAVRRRAQLLAVRPDLAVIELRGNVDTRLRKWAAGEVDVLVLAAAGLDRLGRRRDAGGTLHGDVFVPAPGQGVIAVQAREGSAAADVAVLASHARTLACLVAERAAVRELDASCHTPVGIHADSARIRGFAGLPDGSAWLVDEVVVASNEVAVASDDVAVASDDVAVASDDVTAASDDVTAASDDVAVAADEVSVGDQLVAAARQLARRMLAAGADELLRDAEAMAAR